MPDSIYASLIFYITGGLTVFLIFRRRILKDSHPFNTFFSSNIDLSVYENVAGAIELERERIGSDIHDEMAPHLASLYIDLEIALKDSNGLSVEGSAKLLNMRHKIKHTLVALRRIIYGMLPRVLQDQNFNAALRELCTKNDGTKGTTILFRATGEPFVLSDQKKLYLYRIVQELVNNCLEHSLAWSIFVSVCWTEKELKITIKDNGVGMRKVHAQLDSFGMTGIFIRCKIIGAVARFNLPYEGVEFELTLPKGK